MLWMMLTSEEAVNPLIPEWYQLGWLLVAAIYVLPVVIAIVFAVRAGWPAIHTLAWVLLSIVLPVIGPVLTIVAVIVTRRERRSAPEHPHPAPAPAAAARG